MDYQLKMNSNNYSIIDDIALLIWPKFTLLDGRERKALTIADCFGAGLNCDLIESVVLLLLVGDSMLSLLSLLVVEIPEHNAPDLDDTSDAIVRVPGTVKVVLKFTAKLLKQFFKSFCKEIIYFVY